MPQQSLNLRRSSLVLISRGLFAPAKRLDGLEYVKGALFTSSLPGLATLSAC